MVFDSLKIIFSWKSIFDITAVAILFYQIISMLRGTRAAQVLVGMLVIFVAYVFSNMLQFETLHWIISKFYSSFIIVVIVLFQDDIRRLLSRFGKGPFFTGIEIRSGGLIIQEVVNASKSLSHERIGALIVFERSIGLDKLYDHSVQLNALVSEQLLISIFQSFSPLHDGAVIIQKNRISCASAQLPLSKNPLFSKKMGTRHSAAVGISEETDAVVIVVSEETGHISIAWDGNLKKQVSLDAAKKMMHTLLLPRGERSVVVTFLEDQIFMRMNRFYLNLKTFFSLQSENNPPVERRKNMDRRLFESRHKHDYDSKLIENENKLALATSKNILIRFKNTHNLHEMISTTDNFVTSIGKSNPILSIKNSEESSDFDAQTSPSKKESTRIKTDLAPQERFDPPIPKASPPRDITIGGVSLNPPIEKDMVKGPKNDQDKGNSEE